MVEVLIEGEGGHRAHRMEREPEGWFALLLADIAAGTRYRYRLDEREVFPDPLSRHQPEGVHGPSQVVDSGSFDWTDGDWEGLRLDEVVLYELHVGTFTRQGTFDGAIERLDDLAELGVTAIELMPVAQFPGSRNWGYDGAYWYAPAHAYGGPDGLRRLVDAAHARGLGVVLDVVYNHLGPEGNYLPALSGGAIFTGKHETPWGAAINFDDEGSAAVRRIVIDNALHWIHEYHIDGLRLDATHAIIDTSPRHILAELAESVRGSTDRHVLLFAEDERNERRIVTPIPEGGLGLDAVWADDLHHQVRRCVAGDHEGYFAAYSGTVDDIVGTLRRGWFYEGAMYSPSGESRGTPAADLPPAAFVHCIQNHDQVGNRALGERLNQQVDGSLYRAVSALLLLSPYTPLLWMGQEWAATSPFLYFTDHPEELGKLVTEGRRSEFRHFSSFRDPDERDRIPDPQAVETFLDSKLRWDEALREPHFGIRELYRQLLTLRRSEPALRGRHDPDFTVVAIDAGTLAIRRDAEDAAEALLLVVKLARGEGRVGLSADPATRPASNGRWSVVLATEEARFGGSGTWGRLESNGSLWLPDAGAVVLRG